MPERDEPWNDVPADSDVVPGTEEPDPAEVVGDEGEEEDVSHRSADLSHRDTLDERLAEEEPDRLSAGRDDEFDESADDDEPGAEDAALHVTDRP